MSLNSTIVRQRHACKHHNVGSCAPHTNSAHRNIMNQYINKIKLNKKKKKKKQNVIINSNVYARMHLKWPSAHTVNVQGSLIYQRVFFFFSSFHFLQYRRCVRSLVMCIHAFACARRAGSYLSTILTLSLSLTLIRIPTRWAQIVRHVPFLLSLVCARYSFFSVV